MINRIIFLSFTFLFIGSNAFGQFKDQEIRKPFFIKSHEPQLKSLFEFMLNTDSTIIDSSIAHNSSRFLPVLKEVGLGTLWGLLCSIPGGLIARQFNKEDTWGFGSAAIGVYAGFTFGTSLGVYLGVVEDKPNVSFWGTLASGITGAGVGLGINALSDDKRSAIIWPTLFPLVFSIIYVELFD